MYGHGHHLKRGLAGLVATLDNMVRVSEKCDPTGQIFCEQVLLTHVVIRRRMNKPSSDQVHICIQGVGTTASYVILAEARHQSLLRQKPLTPAALRNHPAESNIQ
jgi:hypothetical protein